MALRNEDREWVSSLVSERINALTPHGWRKLVHVVREMGTIASVVSVLLAMTAVTVGALYYSFSRVDKQARFEQSTTDELKNLHGEISGLRAQIAVDNLRSNVALPSEEFANALPQVAAEIQVLKQQRYKSVGGIATEVQRRLVATDEHASGYWPAAAELISYRSTTSRPSQNESPCGQLNLVIDKETGSAPEDIQGHMELNNCAFYLDKSGFFADRPWKQFNSLILKNVTIHYGGGNIPALPSLIVFQNCVFDFTIPNEPPEPARQLAKTLLAANDITDISYRTVKQQTE